MDYLLVKKKYYVNNSYFKDENNYRVIKNRPKEIINFFNNDYSNITKDNILKEIKYLYNSKKKD